MRCRDICRDTGKYYLIFHIILFFTLVMPLARAEYAFIGEALIKELKPRCQVKYVKLEMDNHDEAITECKSGNRIRQSANFPMSQSSTNWNYFSHSLSNDRIGLTIIIATARVEIRAPRIRALSSANATSTRDSFDNFICNQQLCIRPFDKSKQVHARSARPRFYFTCEHDAPQFSNSSLADLLFGAPFAADLFLERDTRI